MDALEALKKLIEAGVEYPDAHAEIVIKFKLNKKQALKLQEDYDNFCAKGK